MPEAAAPALAESLMAESFVAAAPTMFIPEAAMGAEFGTAAAFEGLGAMEGLGGLSALGSEFGTEALFGGLGGAAETAIPTLSEGIAQGVTSGGFGAGEAGINEALVNAEQVQAANSGFSQAELEAMQQGQELAQNAQNLGQFAEGPGGVAEQEAAQNATKGLIQGSGQIPAVENARGLEQVGDVARDNMSSTYNWDQTSPFEPPPAAERFAGTQNLTQNAGPAQSDMLTKESLRLPIDEVGTNYQNFPPLEGSQRLGQVSAETLPGEYTPNTTIPQQAAPTGLQDQALDFVKKNPFSAASMAYTANSLLNKKTPEEQKAEEYNGPLKYYKMSPNFQGRHANPQDYQYTPKVYAEGGIASFKSGGKSDSLDPTGGGKIASDYYESMLHQQAQNMPSTRSDPGIYYDLDPDTRYLDPVSAAQIRMAKINKRSNVQAQNMKRPTGLGQINLSPPGAKAEAASSSLDPETQAAQGGIMHSGLGGYAAGGNPRLLRGPGDGMSDNIPATIAGKQPARLADGEFVIPADVVSHLGNGSTEAGAKILHAMMTKVRKERTGNPKQGKQINPRKFVPA